jgi:hypothetical protein
MLRMTDCAVAFCDACAAPAANAEATNCRRDNIQILSFSSAARPLLNGTF